MSSPKPTRDQADLADVLELVLDKGIVINADIAITVNDTELLGVELRAAIASFETAAKYGLSFPSGTDMRRVEQASGREPLDDDAADLGIEASSGGATSRPEGESQPRVRPAPQTPYSGAEDGPDAADDEITVEGHSDDESRTTEDDEPEANSDAETEAEEKENPESQAESETETDAERETDDEPNDGTNSKDE